MSWHRTLPEDVQQALVVDAQTLGDFSGAVERLEVLSRLATRRAIEGMAQGMRTQSEKAALGDTVEPADVEQELLEDKEISLRVDVAIRANKELAKTKRERLDAQDKFEGKAGDMPTPANVVFHVRHVNPARKLAALKRLQRFEEARKFAIENNLDYDQVEVDQMEEPA
jgi:hypothetical protein